MSALRALLARRLASRTGTLGWDRFSTRLGVALLIVSAVFFAANFADKAWVSYQVAQQKQQRLSAKVALEQQIRSLQANLKYLHSAQYYINAARPYGYIQPGDIQLQVPQTRVEPQSPPAGAATAARGRTGDSPIQSWLRYVIPGGL